MEKDYTGMLSCGSWISLGIFLARCSPNVLIELFDKGVISREELRHQLALATANAIAARRGGCPPPTKAGERRPLLKRQLLFPRWTELLAPG